MAGDFENASKVRETLYFMLCIAFNSDYPEMVQLFVDESFNMNGHGKFQDFVGTLLDMFKTVKDDKKEIIKSYSSIAELADDKLKTAIDSTFTQILQKAESIYGNDYKNNLKKHIDTIKDNISKIREILPYALAYDGGKYNVENDIKTITTFIGNIDIIPLAHYNEIYSAYAKASKDYDCGYEDHKTKYICIEGENQNVDIKNNDKLTFKFNIDYDTFVKEGKVFIDNNETSRDNYVLSKGSTIVTFNDEYTRALSVGRHTINAVTDEGNVEVEFTVSKTDTNSGNGENSNSNENSPNEQKDEENNKQNNTKSTNPKTGDDIMTWISLAVISMIGLIVTIAKK